MPSSEWGSYIRRGQEVTYYYYHSSQELIMMTRYPPMGKGKGGDYMYEGGYSSKYGAPPVPPVGDGISLASPSDGYNPCKLFIGGIPSDLDQGTTIVSRCIWKHLLFRSTRPILLPVWEYSRFSGNEG